MTTAVLVIDVQQGLCEGDDAAFDCIGTIERINNVTRKARLGGALVIFVQHESKSSYLEYGSRAWQLAAGLELQPTDLRLRKTTPDSFLQTDLEERLRKHDVRELVICGMHSEFCIDTTTRRALAIGFPVLLVSDAHTSAGNATITPQQVIAHENLTLSNISSFGPRARTVTSDSLQISVYPLA